MPQTMKMISMNLSENYYQVDDKTILISLKDRYYLSNFLAVIHYISLAYYVLIHRVERKEIILCTT